jgi:hypothetical protein
LNKGGHLDIMHYLLSPKLIFFKVSIFFRISRSRGRITSNTKLDENIEGADNFQAWKYRVILILEENDQEGFIEK